MSEKTLSDATARACEIASGKVAPAPDEAGWTVRAAHKDLNAKGNGPWWYRMVWRSGSWVYFSSEKLPLGTFRAAERHATTHGEVFLGELVCDHDKGGPVDAMYIVTGGEEPLEGVEFKKRRDGQLAVTLPDGAVVAVPNPRK